MTFEGWKFEGIDSLSTVEPDESLKPLVLQVLNDLMPGLVQAALEEGVVAALDTAVQVPFLILQQNLEAQPKLQVVGKKG